MNNLTFLPLASQYLAYCAPTDICHLEQTSKTMQEVSRNYWEIYFRKIWPQTYHLLKSSTSLNWKEIYIEHLHHYRLLKNTFPYEKFSGTCLALNSSFCLLFEPAKNPHPISGRSDLNGNPRPYPHHKIPSSLKKWSLQSKKCEFTLSLKDNKPTFISDCIHKYVLTNDHFIMGFQDGVCLVYNLNDKSYREFKAHQSHISGIQCDGSRIYTSSLDKTIKIWCLYQAFNISILEGHTDSITDIVLLNNNRLCSSSNDRMIKIWNLEDSTVIYQLKYSTPIVSLRANQNVLVGADITGRVYLYCQKNLQLLNLIDLKEEENSVEDLYVDQTKLVILSSKGNLRIFDLNGLLLNQWKTQIEEPPYRLACDKKSIVIMSKKAIEFHDFDSPKNGNKKGSLLQRIQLIKNQLINGITDNEN